MHFSREEEARLLLKTEDLLICEGGDIGRTAMWSGEIQDCYYQNHLHRARAKRDDVYPPFYLYWLWYAFAVGRVYFGRGNVTTIPNLSKSLLQSLVVPLPSLDEQVEIADALTLIRNAMGERERIVAIVAELKAALMADVFSGGIERAARRTTPIGDLPRHWDVVRLGDVCELGTGTTPSTAKAEYYDGSIPFIKTSDITNNRIRCASTLISQQAVDDHRLKLYPPGSVMMAMYGQGKTRGQVALLEIAAATSQNAAVIRPSAEIDSEYLWLYLMSRYRRLRGTGALGQISHLNLGYLRDLSIAMPPLAEQRAIAELFRDLEDQASLGDAQVNLLKELFHAAMSRLMRRGVGHSEVDMEPQEAALAG